MILIILLIVASIGVMRGLPLYFRNMGSEALASYGLLTFMVLYHLFRWLKWL